MIRFSSYFISFPYFPKLFPKLQQSKYHTSESVYVFFPSSLMAGYVFSLKETFTTFFPCPGVAELLKWWQPARCA